MPLPPPRNHTTALSTSPKKLFDHRLSRTEEEPEAQTGGVVWPPRTSFLAVGLSPRRGAWAGSIQQKSH